MELKSRWLSVYITSPMKNWAMLFNNVIMQFLQENKEQYANYRIGLNHEKENAIRFSILVSDKNYTDFSLVMRKCFRSLHELLPGSMLKFEEFSYADSDSQLHKQFYLETEISGLIIDFFKDKNINQATIFTFESCLHLLLFDLLQKRYQGALNDLVAAYFKPPMPTRRKSEYTEEGGRENTVYCLLDVTLEYLNANENQNYVSAWKTQWINLSQDHLNDTIGKVQFDENNIDDIQSYQIFFSNILNRLLGTNGRLKDVIGEVLLLWAKKPDIQAYINHKKDDHLRRVKKIQNICERMDLTPIPDGEQEIRLFVVARNESLRLPYFLKYYLNLGVDRFFLIDNDSTDDTVKIALSHQNVHVFRICEGYKNHWYWVEYFLDTYGKDRWCIVVDVDELFHPPFFESVSLKKFVSYFESRGYTAMRCLLLDMYADRDILCLDYKQNDNPIKFCQYFDPHIIPGDFFFFDKKKWRIFSERTYTGGMRARIFRGFEDEFYYYCLSKVSFFKYTSETYLTLGMHSINGAVLSDIEGVVLHTKFLHDFNDRVREECERGEHFNGAVEYKIYRKMLETNESPKFANQHSIRFQSSQQLIALGIMKTSHDFDQFCKFKQMEV